MTTSIAILAALASTMATPAAAPPGEVPAEQAYALRMEGRSDQAEALLEKALQQDDRDGAGWFELARTRFYHFQFDGAAEAAAKAIELAPNNARYHYLAGLTAGYNTVAKAKSPATYDQVYVEMGKSLAAFEKAVELDPDYDEARIQLINMLIKAPPEQGGNRVAAEKHAVILEEKNPVRAVEARCMLLPDSSTVQMVALWEQAVAKHPDSADAHAGLASACMRAKNLALAAKHVDGAIRLDPAGQSTILLRLGREHAFASDFENAEAAFKRFLELDPEPPAPLRSSAMFYLAKLQKMQGNDDRAEAILAEAKKIDPRCWMTLMEPNKALFEGP